MREIDRSFWGPNIKWKLQSFVCTSQQSVKWMWQKYNGTIAFRIWVYDLTIKSKLGEDWLHARKCLISWKKWSDPMSQRVDVVGNKKLEQWFSALAHIRTLVLWSHHTDFNTLMWDFWKLCRWLICSNGWEPKEHQYVKAVVVKMSS